MDPAGVDRPGHAAELRGEVPNRRGLDARRLGRDGPGWATRLIYPLTSLWQSQVGLRKADRVFCLSNEDRDYLTENNRTIVTLATKAGTQ